MSEAGNSYSLINADAIGKVGCLLIEKISQAVGWVATHDTPDRISVKQYIEEIQDSDLDPLLKAAKISRAKRDIKEYCNQAKIISDAIPQLNDTADPNQMDDDWLAKFMDQIRFVSSDELRAIWSRVLSQECNEPDSIPLKLIEILSYISVEQAKAFRQLCQFCVFVCQTDPLCICHSSPLVPYSMYKSYFKRHKLTYEKLRDLASIGLVSMTERHLRFNMNNPSLKYQIVIDSHKFLIEATPKRWLPIGNILFTSSGQSLFHLIDIHPPESFVNLCLDYWSKKDVLLAEISESPETKEAESTVNQN